jgi:hypothetical protein
VCERLTKASVYFQEKFATSILPLVENVQAETDNTEIRKQLNNAITWLREETVIKLAAVKSCNDGFSPTNYLRALSMAEMDTAKPRPKPVAVTYTEADVGHPELFDILKEWRKKHASARGVQLFQIMHQKTLVQIAVHLPDTRFALQAIHGIGKKMIEKYGDELVTLVGDYRKKHGIQTVELPDMPLLQIAMAKKEEKEKLQDVGDTKKISLELFRQGKTAAQIAGLRDLTVNTIEKHLAYYVEKGELNIQALVSDEDREILEKAITEMEGATLREIRTAVGPEFSYGDINVVRAYLQHKEQ